MGKNGDAAEPETFVLPNRSARAFMRVVGWGIIAATVGTLFIAPPRDIPIVRRPRVGEVDSWLWVSMNILALYLIFTAHTHRWWIPYTYLSMADHTVQVEKKLELAEALAGELYYATQPSTKVGSSIRNSEVTRSRDEWYRLLEESSAEKSILEAAATWNRTYGAAESFSGHLKLFARVGKDGRGAPRVFVLQDPKNPKGYVRIEVTQGRGGVRSTVVS